MVKLKVINDKVVKLIPNKTKEDRRKAKGYKLFSNPYGGIFAVANTNSGKTTVIYNIIDECAGKDTKVIVFCSTIHNDASWESIEKLCEEKEIDYEAFDSMIDEHEGKKVHLLQELMKRLEQEAKEAKTNAVMVPKKKKFRNCLYPEECLSSEEEEEKPKKSKYIEPKYIIIMDDVSDEIRSPIVAKWLKKARHYFAKTVISSQYPLDLAKSAREQIKYWLLFKNIDEQNLKGIFQGSSRLVPFDEFEDIYQEATRKQYNFFMIDIPNNQYRLNFDKLIEI